MMSHKTKILAALDVDTLEEALALADQLEGNVDGFKVGMQLVTRQGPDAVRLLKERGYCVFLDMKFHDIPNTVAGAVRSAASLGADITTVHACGGPEMLRAAAKAAEGTGLLVAAVTVLTSSDAATLNAAGVSSSVEDQVARLARLALESGIPAVVASPKEIGLIREVSQGKLKIITPGVRPSWAAAGDQKRVMTPAEAASAGADWLVIGRPITAASSPREAAFRIRQEMTV